MGPFPQPPFQHFTCSPLFTVEKKGSTKRRIIHDLSHPLGQSVNSGIAHLPVTLSSFDAGAEFVRAAGKGCWMCKIDITAAYRCIPVRPEDFHLLGMIWAGQYYYDKCLPFGLCSSCAIFEWYSTAAEWIVRHHGKIPFLTHYIDDFFLVNLSKSRTQAQLNFTLTTFKQLGLPVSAEKLVGPTQRITFLGIEIDSVSMEARLPVEKVVALQSELSHWLSKTSTTQRELQSLIGQLEFACKVVRSGRSFLRRLIDVSTFSPHPNTRIPIQLTSPLRLDLNWWHRFVHEWNGTTLLLPTRPRHPTTSIYTDACETGYGAALVRADQPTRWLHGHWPSSELDSARRKSRMSMPYLESLAIVFALSTWAPTIGNSHIEIHCDCLPVVQSLQPLTMQSKVSGIMSCIRTILYLTATHNIAIGVSHIAGSHNCMADLLSRDQIPEFKLLRSDHYPIADTLTQPPISSW
jgi:reverse transcriptase-like protein